MIQWLILASIGAILVFVIIDDIRNYQIRNGAVLALLALSAVWLLLTLTWQTALIHLGFALLLFLALTPVWLKGWMGGGDLKLFAAAFLWLGPTLATPFALALTLFTLLYALATKLNLLPSETVDGRRHMAYGPSITAAWLTVMALRAVAR